ncbi:TRAP transporter small permease [Parageobacillus thermoglucosidasius]|uniref:TRAP transporter small permease n=1 Tax=Parageobacillus thermoglucosidasius TaxID=1426 RepID=UPI00241DF724|nr:TRAP transporter small permease [Parageobacillus thermoglucosidasius]
MALATMALMMFFITFAVIGRALGHPVLGDVEVVQLSMVVLIMFGLAYSQSRDAHVAIDLLVDRFSPRMQALMDVIASILTCIVCLVISWVYWHVAIRYTTEIQQYTDLLEIPLMPFKYIVAVGFFLWGLEALLKVFLSLVRLSKGSVEGGDA